MQVSPVTPTLGTLPNLTLQRTNGTATLIFTGTAVDPGFKASANYFLEACAHGNNFKDSVIIMTSVQDTIFKITVSDLNGILLKTFPANQVSSLDFRIRSVLLVDAGTGAPGTSAKPFVYRSAVKTADVTIYGLPRLDIISNGVVIGKIESALGDGKYGGYVKFDKTKSFTLKDPDANIVYGGSGSTISVNGAAINPADNGWFKVTANTQALTLNASPYMVSAVGDFTGWGSGKGNVPGDIFMDYNSQTGSWYTTVDLPTGPMKFRFNAGWAFNWGPDNAGGDAPLPTDGKINLPDSKGNIVINAAGNYTIYFTINADFSSGSAVFILNQ